MSLRIISGSEVRQFLPMDECVSVMEKAMVAASTGTVSIPPRTIMPLIDKTGFFGLMPGSSSEPRVYGAKVVSLHPGNPAQGRPPIQGFVTLFDHDTGAPIAIIEGGEITAIRTAAASGLATRFLAREDASTHGIFGAGVQAVSHIDAVHTVRPSSEVIIWNRSSDKAVKLAKEQAARTGLNIRATSDPKEAAACDIVSTVTSSPEPVLFGEWLKAGTHVNLVGAHSPTTREADSALIKKSALYIDLMESARNEAGEILMAIDEGAIELSHIVGEIGRVTTGDVPARSGDDQVTVYKSLGITAQDLYAAHHVFHKAVAANEGFVVDL